MFAFITHICVHVSVSVYACKVDQIIRREKKGRERKNKNDNHAPDEWGKRQKERTKDRTKKLNK